MLTALDLEFTSDDAVEVSQAWLNLFPEGAPLSWSTASASRTRVAGAPDAGTLGIPPDARIGDVLVYEDEDRFLVTDDGTGPAERLRERDLLQPAEAAQASRSPPARGAARCPPRRRTVRREPLARRVPRPSWWVRRARCCRPTTTADPGSPPRHPAGRRLPGGRIAGGCSRRAEVGRGREATTVPTSFPPTGTT